MSSIDCPALAANLRRKSLLPLVLLVSALLISCGGSASDASGGAYGENNPASIGDDKVTVEMKDLQFGPQGIKVKPGTTVTWVNKDPVVHNVRQVESVFLSPDEMPPDATFSFTFNKPGRYRYVCTYHHPNMNGVVIVE